MDKTIDLEAEKTTSNHYISFLKQRPTMSRTEHRGHDTFVLIHNKPECVCEVTTVSCFKNRLTASICCRKGEGALMNRKLLKSSLAKFPPILPQNSKLSKLNAATPPLTVSFRHRSLRTSWQHRAKLAEAWGRQRACVTLIESSEKHGQSHSSQTSGGEKTGGRQEEIRGSD